MRLLTALQVLQVLHEALYAGVPCMNSFSVQEVCNFFGEILFSNLRDEPWAWRPWVSERVCARARARATVTNECVCVHSLTLTNEVLSKTNMDDCLCRRTERFTKDRTLINTKHPFTLYTGTDFPFTRHTVGAKGVACALWPLQTAKEQDAQER